MDIANTIQTIAIFALPVLFAITVHEAAHGYAARHFGDKTAEMLGRLTLNPLPHIDPIGTIAIPLLLFFVSGGNMLFGYAKPVPVITRNLRNPRRDMVWVALAGPASNFAMGLGWGLLLLALHGLGLREPFFLGMCQGGIVVNVVMFALNMFPLPPLDGGRILAGLLPPQGAALLARVEPFGFFIVMALIMSGVLSALWMQPVMSLTFSLMDLLTAPLAALLR